MKTTLLILSVFAPLAAFGQAVWNEVDPSWSNTANWTPTAIPTSSSAVQINSTQSGIVGLDTGAGVTIASLTFNSGLSQGVDFVALGPESLQVNGAITNNSGFTSNFSVAMNAGASATWTGPLSFSNIVNIGTNQVTLANTSLFAGASLNFDITNTSTYGRFLGAGTATVTGVTINLGGSYAGTAGDTFDLTSGSFSGATLGTLPTLSGGLSWNTSNFLADGTLTVIPEPGTWILVTASLLAIVLLRRRKLA